MTLAGGTGGKKRKPATGRKNDGDSPPMSRPDPAGLLAWYDRHRRRLPWRALPGETPDPYRVWLSEIMLQQTTVTAVAPYYAKFLVRFPTVRALAAADIEDVRKLWAGLGYYARAHRLHACARAVVARHGGAFPETETDLLALPGIGPYTAAAVAAIAFDRPATPVDGNVERVIARLYAVAEELPAAKAAIRALAEELRPAGRPGDFAQAMMDLGATICTPKNPACALCPFMAPCAARRRGDAERFPRKAKKREGRLRHGAAFVVLRADGHLLVRTRPTKGLLGGMTEVPTTAFRADFDAADAIGQAPRLVAPHGRTGKPRWRRLPGVVTHVFTHFPLALVVYRAQVPTATGAPDGMRWIAPGDIAGAALPGLMRKVLAHAGVDYSATG
jgi:A/G-specific adenine glycosylase